MTSTRPKEESLRISDAPKIDNFWGLPEPQIPEPVGDTTKEKGYAIRTIEYLQHHRKRPFYLFRTTYFSPCAKIQFVLMFRNMAAKSIRLRQRPIGNTKPIINKMEPFSPCIVVVLVGVLGTLIYLLFSLHRSSFAGDYLYYGEGGVKDPRPVIEYVDSADERGSPSSQNDDAPPRSTALFSKLTWANKETALPDFLNSTGVGPRVVEFYAPWCPHCQHFVSKYILLAKSVQAKKEGRDVAFYAVSCTAHRDICLEKNIQSFPTIMLFRAGNRTGEIVKETHRMTAWVVLELLRPDVSFRKSHDQVNPELDSTEKVSEKKREENKKFTSYLDRTTAETFSDASLSFDYALRNSIHMSKGPLTIDEKEAFRNWIELVHRIVPQQMKSVYKQTTAILESFDVATQDSLGLKGLIHSTNPSEDDWSPSCMHGSTYSGAGYTCGLWQLFHIVTLGVAETERNRAGGNNGDLISASHAANTLRDYVDHFFACNVCRDNFLEMFDACAFERCTRIPDDTIAGSSLSVQKELALWLWEMHNDVNIRLQREKASRDGMSKPSEEEVWDVRWPTRAACYSCWDDDGRVGDKNIIYEFLISEYWVQDSRSLRGESHKKGVKFNETVNAAQLRSFKRLSWVAAVGILFYCSFQRQKKYLSGQHKKTDSAPISLIRPRKVSTLYP